MDGVFSFFSPRKQQPPAPSPASEAQTPSQPKTLWNKDDTQSRTSLGGISSPALRGVTDQARSIASPAAVAAAKYPIEFSDPIQPEEKSDDVEMADADTDQAPPPPELLSLVSPQARRSVRTSEAHIKPNPEDAAQDEEMGEDEQFDFKGFLGHRQTGKGNDIEIQVEWEQGPPTWEPEENMHRDCPETLFAYWASQGGRPLNPNDPDMFEIFAIRKHSKNKKRLQVEWLGYDKSEWTWLPREVVEETAKEVVEAYWKDLKKTK